MSRTIAVATGLVLVALFLLFSTTYTVKYNEVAIKRRTFGESQVVRDAGLHFRLTFLDRVAKLDRRLQVVESPLEEIVTDDEIQLVVRAFLLWRIDAESETGPGDFYTAFVDTDGAARSLQASFRTAMTSTLGRFRFGDLFGEASRLGEVEAEILAAMRTAVAGQGVLPVAVGVSQIVLPTTTADAVLRRMKGIRDEIAEGERKLGTSRAEAIRSKGASDADKIRTFCGALAAEIRASGEADAAAYITQMSRDEDLAKFLISLDQLGRALTQNTTVVLPAEQLEPVFESLDAATVRGPDDLAKLVGALAADARRAGVTEAADYLDELSRGEGAARLYRILEALRDPAAAPMAGAEAAPAGGEG
jgi:membrane protease subunit HflC